MHRKAPPRAQADGGSEQQEAGKQNSREKLRAEGRLHHVVAIPDDRRLHHYGTGSKALKLMGADSSVYYGTI